MTKYLKSTIQAVIIVSLAGLLLTIHTHTSAKIIAAQKVSFELLAGAGHGGPQFSAPSNLEKVILFFDKYLK